MMHSPAPNEEGVVIIRKRKRRHAIDPCLGFYGASFTPQPVLSNQEASDDSKTSDTSETPAWTVLEAGDDLSSPDVTSPQLCLSSEDAITVEEFLRRNARRVHLRRYGRRYKDRRIIRSSSSSPPPSLDDDSIDQLDEDDQLRSLPASRRALSDNPEGRPALRLLPSSTAVDEKLNHARPKPRAIRLWGLADSRKGIPFRQSSFSDRPEKKASDSKLQHPLNTWNNTKCQPRSLDQETLTPAASPLVLLPVITSKVSSGQPEACSVSVSKVMPASANVLLSTKVPSGDAYVPPVREDRPKARSDVGSEISRFSSSSPDPNALPYPALSAGKLLRPLGCFLDGFLERVRTATQNEITSKDIKVNNTIELVSSPTGNVADSDRTLFTSSRLDNRKPVHVPSDPAKRPPRSLTCMTSTSRTEDTPMHVASFQIDSVQEESSATAPFDINAALLFYA
ncbi:hypothetical protein H0H92_011384 [Tricholoma furcatifolium]|nr:hypothetical protein H0H92_011384 [Tricholoma furcatifolium]